MKKLTLTLIFLITAHNVWAQSDQDAAFEKQFEEIMKARQEMLNSLMDDSFSGDMEKRLLEMMKRFSAEGSLPPGFGNSQQNSAVTFGEYDWVVTDTEKIFKLKVKQIKDHPLDIKIEKGVIRFKGDIEGTRESGNKKIKEKVKFEQSFTLPDDIDQTNPQFEYNEKAGEYLIRFKRLVKAAPKKQDRIPVAPTGNDLNI